MSNWDNPNGENPNGTEPSQPHREPTTNAEGYGTQPGWQAPGGATQAYPTEDSPRYQTAPQPGSGSTAPMPHHGSTPGYNRYGSTPPSPMPPQPQGPVPHYGASQQGYSGAYQNPQQPPHPHNAPSGYLPPQAPKPGVMWLRPQTVGDTLEVAFSTIKGNPGATFGVSILTSLLGLALTVLIVASTGGAIMNAGSSSSGSVGAVAIIAMLIALPLMALINLASMTALVHVFSQAVLGNRTSMGEALKVGMKRIWSALGASILLTLMYVVAFVLMIVVLVALAQADVHPVILGILAVVIGLAVICFGVRFAFILHAVVMESAGPTTALGRSVRLTRKRSLRTFGVLLLGMIVVMVVSSVVQMIGGALSSAVVGTSGSALGGDTSNVSTAALIGSVLITGLLGMLVGAFTQPFLLNLVGALYLDARFRDEGLAAALASQSGGYAQESQFGARPGQEHSDTNQRYGG